MTQKLMVRIKTDVSASAQHRLMTKPVMMMMTNRVRVPPCAMQVRRYLADSSLIAR